MLFLKFSIYLLTNYRCLIICANYQFYDSSFIFIHIKVSNVLIFFLRIAKFQYYPSKSSVYSIILIKMKKINFVQKCHVLNQTNEEEQTIAINMIGKDIKQFRSEVKDIIFTIIKNLEKNLNSRHQIQQPLITPPLLIEPINQNIYNKNKMQSASNQSPSTHLSQSRTGLLKKIYCPQHGDKYAFRCKYPNCQVPFFCLKIQCIEAHLHQNELSATKFDSKELVQNFAKVEKMMHSESVQNSVKRLKKFIDELKNSLKHVYTNLKSYNQTYEELRGTVDSPLNFQFIEKVNTTCELEQSIKKEMKDLKSKINFVEPVRDRDFIFKDELISFLSRQLTHFDWYNCEEIFSSNNELIPCERFHQKLCNKNPILFIFIGQERIIGSYYSKPYPSIKEQSKNLFDTDSFLFISPQVNYYSSGKSNNGNSSKQAALMADLELNDHPQQCRSTISQEFVKFQANQDVEAHLSISKNHYISHGNISTLPEGLRTFQKNIDTIDYNMPSKAYNRSTSQVTFDGKLKVKFFTILQVKTEQE